MKIVHSYTFIPRGFKLDKGQLYLMTLSFLLAKRHYGQIVLYTDIETKKLVEDIGLQYDMIDVSLLNDLKSGTFSIPKLVVYANQNEPFIHIDIDTLIFQKINFNKDISSFATFREGSVSNVLELTQENNGFYGVYIKPTFELKENLPIEFKKYINFKDGVPNMSVFGGNNFELISKSAKYCLEIYDKNKDFFDKEFYNACIIEQLFVSCAMSMFGNNPNQNHIHEYLFNEHPNSFMSDSNSEYPFKIKSRNEIIEIKDEEDLFKNIMYNFNGFLHLNGSKAFQKIIFLVKQRILYDFDDGILYINNIEKIFDEIDEMDILSEKYIKYLKKNLELQKSINKKIII